MTNLAVGIKSFMREDSLNTLLESVKKYLPDSKVYIDKETSNLALGRNNIVKQITEDFFLYCDDDFELKGNDYQKIIEIMSKNEMDVVCGELYLNGEKRWSSENIIFKNRKLTMMGSENKFIEIDGFHFKKIDYGFYFFIAKTKIFEKLKWDEKCIIGSEKWDFFLTAKQLGINIYFCPELSGTHLKNIPNTTYSVYHDRTDGHAYFAKKWGLDVVDDGTITDLRNYIEVSNV